MSRQGSGKGGSTERMRIDYSPGPAAAQALAKAEALLPPMSRQAMLDRLVIVAVSVLAHQHWSPPALAGGDRHRWRLPPALRAERAFRNSETGSPGAAYGEEGEESGTAGGG